MRVEIDFPSAHAGEKFQQAGKDLCGVLYSTGVDAGALLPPGRTALHSGFEGAVFAGEVGRIVGKNEILAGVSGVAFGENALALDDGGDEGGFRQAAVVVSGDEQAGKTRIQRQRGHLAAGVC